MTKRYDTGLSKWTHGDRWPGINDYHVWLGPCPDCGMRTFDYGGGWRCIGDYCNRSVSNSAPSVGAKPTWWETNINVRKDGNAWMAYYDGFTNLMESPCTFANTPGEAVNKLLEVRI